MYGLPKGLSLKFLCGKTLVQVCVGAHDMILNFDDDVSVTVTSHISCAGPDGAARQYHDFARAMPDLKVFLNQTIAKAEGNEDGTLLLAFDAVGTLAIYDDSAEYESYTIRHGKRVIVV